MNSEAGFSASGVPYEYTVAEQKNTKLVFKRITLIAVYVLWVVGFLMAGAIIKLIVPMLALIPLTLWILVFFTWRLTQVEYEYSFFSGVLTVSRVLGGKTRKEICKVTIRELSEVLPYEDEYISKIEAFGAQHTIFAASSEDAPALFAALWKDENGERRVLFFEPNEKAIKILRYYNMSAVTLRKNKP